MPRTNVRAARYAKAAFGVGEQEGLLDDWSTAIERSAALFEDRRAEQYLTSRVVSPDRKIAALAELLPSLPASVGRFLDLLARRDRLELVPRIAAEFRRLLNERRGIDVATVTTAVPLDASQRELIAARLGQRFGKQFTLETHVDPSILGGVMAQVGDDVIDDSVRGRLERLRRSLMA